MFLQWRSTRVFVPLSLWVIGIVRCNKRSLLLCYEWIRILFFFCKWFIGRCKLLTELSVFCSMTKTRSGFRLIIWIVWRDKRALNLRRSYWWLTRTREKWTGVRRILLALVQWVLCGLTKTRSAWRFSKLAEDRLLMIGILKARGL